MITSGTVSALVTMGMKWAGKTFRSTEDVYTIMVYKEGGERVGNAD